MTPTALAAAPGAFPGISGLVHEHLTALAQRYDDAAEHLGVLRARVAEAGEVHGTWCGPGARLFKIRVEQDVAGLGEDIAMCREVSRTLRWSATALADRLAELETAAGIGAPLLSTLGAVLGPGLLTAPAGRRP
ncbi:hypothetical protein AABM36_00540 [Kocuria sp. KSNUG]|uniref:hypothetical protein n=1 Tax=Kocuria sp. KSNUG TaxID=3136676 RepID=UPI003C2D182A